MTTSSTDAFKDAEIAREELRSILNRGNVIQHWPDDEAAAYRDNGGWSEGMEAVDNIRIDKIIELVSRQSPATTTAADLAERVEKRLRAEWPGTKIPMRMAYVPSEIRGGGATDTFIHLVARVIREEVAAPEGDGGNE